jgi:hypothetical protein
MYYLLYHADHAENDHGRSFLPTNVQFTCILWISKCMQWEIELPHKGLIVVMTSLIIWGGLPSNNRPIKHVIRPPLESKSQYARGLLRYRAPELKSSWKSSRKNGRACIGENIRRDSGKNYTLASRHCYGHWWVSKNSWIACPLVVALNKTPPRVLHPTGRGHDGAASDWARPRRCCRLLEQLLYHGNFNNKGSRERRLAVLILRAF